MAQFIGIYNAAAHIEWLKNRQNVDSSLSAETRLRMSQRNGNPVALFDGVRDEQYPYTLICKGVNYGIPKEAVIRYIKVGTYNHKADTFAPEWFAAFDGSPVYMEDSPYAKNGVIWDEEKERYYDINEHAIIRR